MCRQLSGELIFVSKGDAKGEIDTKLPTSLGVDSSALPSTARFANIAHTDPAWIVQACHDTGRNQAMYLAESIRASQYSTQSV